MADYIDSLLSLFKVDVDEQSINQMTGATDAMSAAAERVNTIFNVVQNVLIAGFIPAVNSATSQTDALAQSVGTTYNELEAWGGVLGNIGFDAETAADLMEELNNKIGEAKGEELEDLSAALDVLGLSFTEIQKLSPEEQFKAITQAAKDLEDQQEAVSAADRILGSEANKLIGFLRTQEGTVNDLIGAQKELILTTEQGLSGAAAGAAAVSDLMLIGKTLIAEFSGQVGFGIAEVAEGIKEWVAENKVLIQQFVAGFGGVIGSVISVLGTSVGFLIDIFLQLSSAIGGNETAMKLLTVAAFAFGAVKLGQMVIGVANAFKVARLAALAFNASALLIPLLIGAAVAAVALAVEDVVTFINGGDSALGRMLEKYPVLAEIIKTSAEVAKFAWEGLLIVIDAVVNAVTASVQFIGEQIDSIISAVTGIPDKLAAIGGRVSSFFGFGDDQSSTPADVSNIANTNNTSSVNVGSIQINGAENMNPQQLAVEIQRTLGGIAAQGVRATNPGIIY